MNARAAWLAAPTDNLALADHLATALQPLLESPTRPLREQATQLVADREDLWAPIALRLGEWVTHKQKALDQEPQIALVKQAVEWLKRQCRRAPEPAASNRWQNGPGKSGRRLRQESNVGLDAIRLAGENTNRRVELDADVDGVKAGAFGVMSQGELHALALGVVPAPSHRTGEPVPVRGAGRPDSGDGPREGRGIRCRHGENRRRPAGHRAVARRSTA